MASQLTERLKDDKADEYNAELHLGRTGGSVVERKSRQRERDGVLNGGSNAVTRHANEARRDNESKAPTVSRGRLDAPFRGSVLPSNTTSSPPLPVIPGAPRAVVVQERPHVCCWLLSPMPEDRTVSKRGRGSR